MPNKLQDQTRVSSSDLVIDLRVDETAVLDLRGVGPWDHLIEEHLNEYRSLIDKSVAERLGVRIFDILASALLLVLSAPILVVAGILVVLTSQGMPLFFSQRYGIKGTTFKAIKLRTMAPVRYHEDLLDMDPAARVALVRDFKAVHDPRVTGIGRVLRVTSLDEVPQLMNVLFGQMSLVGPRPKLMEEAERYGDVFPLILTVKPGLTGSWQTSGRNDLEFDSRIGLDLAYARGRSFRWDLKICAKTVKQLLSPHSHGAC